MSVKVAITQMSCSANIQANIHKAISLVEKAAKEGANIILLQELFSSLYFCQVEDYNNFSLAENKNDSALIKTPTGQCYEEKFYFSPGDTGYKIFKTKFGKIGVGICWDQWFPEVARILALKGAELLVYPTAIGSEPVLVKDSMIHWRNTMCGHAAANIIPLLASNRVGVESVAGSTMTFGGYSFIANQYGEVVKELSRVEEGYAIYEFDLDSIDKDRIYWGVFRDRRIDSYSPLLEYGNEDE